MANKKNDRTNLEKKKKKKRKKKTNLKLLVNSIPAKQINKQQNNLFNTLPIITSNEFFR